MGRMYNSSGKCVKCKSKIKAVCPNCGSSRLKRVVEWNPPEEWFHCNKCGIDSHWMPCQHCFASNPISIFGYNWGCISVIWRILVLILAISFWPITLTILALWIVWKILGKIKFAKKTNVSQHVHVTPSYTQEAPPEQPRQIRRTEKESAFAYVGRLAKDIFICCILAVVSFSVLCTSLSFYSMHSNDSTNSEKKEEFGCKAAAILSFQEFKKVMNEKKVLENPQNKQKLIAALDDKLGQLNWDNNGLKYKYNDLKKKTKTKEIEAEMESIKKTRKSLRDRIKELKEMKAYVDGTPKKG